MYRRVKRAFLIFGTKRRSDWNRVLRVDPVFDATKVFRSSNGHANHEDRSPVAVILPSPFVFHWRRSIAVDDI